MNTYVVIPAHNESGRIQNTIQKVQQHSSNIIVVDDGSTDQTYQEAINCKVTVLKHSINLGKGAALKTGCDYALLNGATTLIVLDADGQHDPQEIPKFLRLLNSHEIVFGARAISPTMPAILKVGNKFLTSSLKWLYGVQVDDSQCGYRAFTAQAYQKVRWAATDYFMETEMIVNAGKHKLKSTQVPIETIYNDKYKGTTVIDGAKIM